MFQKGPFIVLRLIGALFLVGLMVGGGFMAYNAGVSQALAQAPEVAKAIEQASENGQPVPFPPMLYGHGYGYGYGPGMYPYHHFGFFPFGGICGSLLFLLFFFGLMKMIFFRSMWWGHRGSHGHHWGGPPWMRPEDGESEEKDRKPEDKK